jgi:hypothetical protein
MAVEITGCGRMRNLALLFAVLLAAAGAVPVGAAAGEPLRQYFLDYYGDFRDENGTRVVVRNARISVAIEAEDPVVKNIVQNEIQKLRDRGITNLEISADRQNANLLIKSAASVRKELLGNKNYYQRFFDAQGRLESRANKLNDTTTCDLMMRARLSLARNGPSKVKKRDDLAYVIFNRLASIPAKIKCAKIGILMVYGFQMNANSSVPSVFRGNEWQLEFSDEDLEALKLVNSESVKDLQSFATLLDQLN